MAGQQDVIIWLNSVLMILTLTALCARVGRRVFVVGTFGFHDALITIAAASACIFSIFQIVGINYGLGLHSEDTQASKMVTLAKLLMASNCFYFLCNWAVKHALLLFYYDITRDKKHHWCIYVMHFVAFGFGSSSILVNIFQCRPFHKAWDAAVPGYCVNLNIFFYFNSSIMLCTDVILYAMPVVFTWSLQLHRPQRIGLNCLFALGGLVLAASAARSWSVHKFATQPDFPWWFANAMIWSVVENHIAIVVACAPSMKVIALIIFPQLASSLNKIVSKVTPSGSRSRSRVSAPFDLESGTRKSDKLKPTPSSTSLPSPALTMGSGKSRASQNFAKWFKMPASPTRMNSGDSLEDTGLVYVEELRDAQLSRMPNAQSNDVRNSDIRVSHTITVEEGKGLAM